MSTFSKQQFAQIDVASARQVPRRYLRRLREIGVETQMADEDALRVIDQALIEAKQLNIEEDDFPRFLRLVFWRLRHSIDAKTADLIFMTLANVDAPSRDRKDFIENQILRNRLY